MAAVSITTSTVTGAGNSTSLTWPGGKGLLVGSTAFTQGVAVLEFSVGGSGWMSVSGTSVTGSTTVGYSTWNLPGGVSVRTTVTGASTAAGPPTFNVYIVGQNF